MQSGRLIYSIITILICHASCKSALPRHVVGKSLSATPEIPTVIDDMPTDPNSTSLAVLDQIMAKESPEQCSAASGKSRAKLRLLNRKEYQNTLVDILLVTKDYSSYLPEEARVSGFANNVDALKVNDTKITAFMGNAMEIATEILPTLPLLISCKYEDGQSCAEAFLSKKAEQLWRRPLTAAEKTSLLSLYKANATASKEDAMLLLMSTVLISPNFLYRFEVGKEGALDAYEIASALSYFFWGRPPDQSLLVLAENGKIKSDATLLSEAKRLLADDRGKYLTREFSEAWLSFQKGIGVAKDKTAYPKLTEELQKAMGAEVEDSMDYWIRAENKTFEGLFTADYSLASKDLAAYYGETYSLENSIGKTKFTKTPRRGVLGFGAVLASLATATETHPIKRGDFVLKNMFCKLPEPTPIGLMVKVPDPQPNLTTRERYAQHSANAACRSCHVAIDGIGFGMEDFGAGGEFRSKENGKDIDATGSVVGIDKKTIPFDGTAKLSEAIAQSREAKRCYVVEWFRMANGQIESEQDVCSIRSIADRFEVGKMTVAELLIAIITDPSYSAKGN